MLRQINQALVSVGFDPQARKSVLTKFVRERFSSVAGQADDLADEILRETTTAPPTVMPVPVPPVIPHVTATPVQIIVVPHPHSGHYLKAR